jgi:hypothetical protein
MPSSLLVPVSAGEGSRPPLFFLGGDLVGKRRSAFDVGELVKVPPPTRPVILKSGSPVMDVESVEGDQALCCWRENDGKLCRAVYDVACLYDCVQFRR